jgi:hypothetical protein
MAKTQRISTFLMSGCLLVSMAAGGCSSYEKTGVDTVRQQKGDLQACIGDASTRNPSLKGKAAAMDLAFEIAPDGSVQTVNVDKDKAGDPGLVDCLSQRARTWRFPAPASGKVEKFKYQFNAHFP